MLVLRAHQNKVLFSDEDYPAISHLFEFADHSRFEKYYIIKLQGLHGSNLNDITDEQIVAVMLSTKIDELIGFLTAKISIPDLKHLVQCDQQVQVTESSCEMGISHEIPISEPDMEQLPAETSVEELDQDETDEASSPYLVEELIPSTEEFEQDEIAESTSSTRTTDPVEKSQYEISIQLYESPIQRIPVVIYAPPASGKTTFITENKLIERRRIRDTDDINAWKYFSQCVITNMPHLLHNADISISILPSRETFNKRCKFRGLKPDTSWYCDARKLSLKSNICIQTDNFVNLVLKSNTDATVRRVVDFLILN